MLINQKNVMRISFILVLCISLAFLLCNLPMYTVSAETAYDFFVGEAIQEEELEKFKIVANDFYGKQEPSRVKLLYNINDSPEYILAEFGEAGYEIYHRITGILLEKSELAVSPYSEINGKAYYFGPMNYSELKANDIFIGLHDFSSGVSFSSSQHYLKCAICGKTLSSPENHIIICTYNSTTHSYTCEKCDYNSTKNHAYSYSEYNNLKHYKDCACGYTYLETHNFLYKSKGSIGHSIDCSYCDYSSELSPHKLMIVDKLTGRMRCRDCGYSTGGTTKIVGGN